MFFKPAAAYQKWVAKADGSRDNLPEIGDLADPELQKSSLTSESIWVSLPHGPRH